MLAWIDLETTGLRANKEEILEIACILTDDALKEIGRFEMVLGHRASAELASITPDTPDDVVAELGKKYDIDPFVIRMHAKSGLWALSSNSTIHAAMADGLLTMFFQAWNAKDAQLAGSTISFDRAFMAEHLPHSLAMLHYRNLDVSTLNEVGRRFWPDVYNARPNAGTPKDQLAHRAMADILESMTVLRHYLNRIVPTGQPMLNVNL